MNILFHTVFVTIIVCLVSINFNILYIESYLNINIKKVNFHVYHESGCGASFLDTVSLNISKALQTPRNNVRVSCANDYQRNFTTSGSNNFYSLHTSESSLQKLNIIWAVTKYETIICTFVKNYTKLS